MTTERSRSRITGLTAAKAIDQGAIFGGSLLVAHRLGPAAFAPLATLIVFNSLAVQLSDLGLGFAVHGSPIDAPFPARSMRRVRRWGVIAALGCCLVGLAVGSPYPVLAGCIWPASAEAYVRTVASLRSRGSGVVVRAQITGAAVFLVLCGISWATRRPELLGIGLVLKHLTEIALLRTRWEVDDSSLRSGHEWSGQIATFAASNADYLVVGLAFTPAQYSIYLMAFRLVAAVPSVIAQALTQDAFVRFASGVDGGADRFVSYATRLALRLGVVAMVVGIGVAGMAQLVLGHDWAGLASTGVWLAFALPARLLLGPLVATAISCDRPGLVTVAEVRRGLAVLACTAVGARWGLAGAAVGTSVGTIAGVATLRWQVGRVAQATRS